MTAVQQFGHLRRSEARNAYPRPSSLEFDVIGLHGDRGQMETHATQPRRNDRSVMRLGVSRNITARNNAEKNHGRMNFTFGK
jgi:hypothetical protein